MSLADFWFRFKQQHLSKPAQDRPLFKAVRQHCLTGRKVSSLLEVGLGDGSRTTALFQWLKHHGQTPQKYAAIDTFEAGGPGNISLKAAHKLISAQGIKPFFMPGDFSMAALRVMHTLGACDMVVLSDASISPENPAHRDLISRLTHDQSLLIIRGTDGNLKTCQRPAHVPQERRSAA